MQCLSHPMHWLTFQSNILKNKPRLLNLIAMLGKIHCFFLVIPTLLKGDIEKEYNSENTITIFPKRQLHTWRFYTIEFRKHHKKLLFSHDDCTPEDSIQFNSESTINNDVHMTIPHLKVPFNSIQFFLKENCTLEGSENTINNFFITRQLHT